MDLDKIERQIAHLNRALFGHREGLAAAARAAQAEGGPGGTFTAEDLDRLLSEARSPFALASEPMADYSQGFHNLADRLEALEREVADLKEELAARPAPAPAAPAEQFVDAQGEPTDPPA